MIHETSFILNVKYTSESGYQEIRGQETRVPEDQGKTEI